MVFATCSLEPAEGRDIVSAVLGEAGGLRVHPLRTTVFGATEQMITGDGMLRTLPCHLADLGGMDGFFAARIQQAPANDR